MRTNASKTLPAMEATVFLLLLCLTPLAYAQPPKPPASGGEPFWPFPGSPLGLSLLAPGMRPPLQYETSIAHTRPELANKNLPVGPEYLREGLALGNGGVVEDGRYPLPFGTKGEKVGLVFLSGDYLPPEGEKLQPALAQLARKRAGQLSAQGTGIQPSVYALILLNGRLDDGLQTWLQERGVQLLGFYPYTAYQARIPVSPLNAVASHPQVRWVGQPYPLQKLDPELRMFMGDTSGERIWLFVNLFGHDESAREAIAGMVESTGTYDPSLGVLPIVTDAATVNRLLDMDAVLFVEPIRQSVAHHTQSQASINADLLWYYQHDGRPEGGRSIKVGEMDSGFNIYHWDFTNIIGGTAGYNRTTETNLWDDQHGHGTHVLGTFIGEGVAQARYRGTAQGVQDTNVDGFDLLVSKVFRGNGKSEGSSVWEGLLDMQGRELRYRRQVFNYSGGASGTNLR
ncbi:MAG: S8 family serine peptidase [Armatimonadota bacterium]